MARPAANILRFFEISLTKHTLLNPFSLAKLDLIGELSRFDTGARLLDIACGTGEMLCRWAEQHGIRGVGVDVSAAFLGRAEARAKTLGLSDRVDFILGEGAEYLRASTETFDAVSCLGATWIGGGLVGTLEQLAPRLADGGVLLVGEPFWREAPPDEAVSQIAGSPDLFTSLDGTRERFEGAGFELTEMVLGNEDDWDRYEATTWATSSDWIAANPNDPDLDAFRDFTDSNRQQYLRYGRRYLGWGVFVLRPFAEPRPT